MADAPLERRVPRGTEGPLAPAEQPSHCKYCGAELNPRYYFCLSCATPYKDERSVLPRARPMRLTDHELIKKKSPQVWGLFFTYLGVVVLNAIIAGFLFAGGRPELTLMVTNVSIAFVTFISAFIYWNSLAAQLRRMGFDTPAAYIGLGMLVPMLIVNYFYHEMMTELAGIEDVSLIGELRDAGVTEPGLIVGICVFPAVSEEIAFRGLIQHWLSIAVKPMKAIMLASLLFAILHFSMLSLPYLFAVGMLLGWTKWKTQSLYPSMVIHFLHNLIVLEFFGH